MPNLHEVIVVSDEIFYKLLRVVVSLHKCTIDLVTGCFLVNEVLQHKYWSLCKSAQSH